MSPNTPIRSLLNRFPLGYGEARYNNRRYATRRTLFNQGRSEKFYAEELGGTDFVSLNLYHTRAGGEQLRPCEMTPKKVITFLQEADPIRTS